MVRTDREIVSNIENSLCLGSDVYVLGDVNMDLMKGTNYTLYNDLVMLGLDQLVCEVKCHFAKTNIHKTIRYRDF